MNKKMRINIDFTIPILITLLLMILKVTDVVAIAWWIVFAPIWGTAIIIVLAITVITIYNIIKNTKRM